MRPALAGLAWQVGYPFDLLGLVTARTLPSSLPSPQRRGTPHWHASHVGSLIRHNLGSSSSFTADNPGALPLALFPAAMPPPTCAPPEEFTAFNSPPRPVDFSADVAASVRR